VEILREILYLELFYFKLYYSYSGRKPTLFCQKRYCIAKNDV